ncbi:MAG: cytochrome c-type biosis protein CcmH [Abditibacteriota bacterium]|nr:cytochrome c-type biosis protein CcmH [Abditibacteriota bacterium]
MTRPKYFYSFALLFVMLVSTASLHAQKPATMREVAKLLICPCPDCGKQALDQCPDGCADGKKHRDEIVALMGENKTQDEILTFFSTTYGAHMLGIPPNEGLGKLASWVPYGVVALALLPVFFFSRARRGRGQMAQPAGARARGAKGKGPAVEDPRLAAALKEFDY